MKVFFLILTVFVSISSTGFCEDVPQWVFKQAQKEGDVWLFSGSAHDISLMNIGIPLARAAALSNLALAIGVNISQQVNRSIEGSEIDGYVENIAIAEGYKILDVAAYGVRTREMYVERFHDPYAGRQKLNVHVLMEISDADLRKAKEAFLRMGAVKKQSPVMKSKKDEGLIARIKRKVGL